MAPIELDSCKNEGLSYLHSTESNNISVKSKKATTKERFKSEESLNLRLNLSLNQSNLDQSIECLFSELNQNLERKSFNVSDRFESNRKNNKVAIKASLEVEQKNKEVVLGCCKRMGRRIGKRNRLLSSLVWLVVVPIGAIWELFSAPSKTSLSLHLTRSTFQVAQATSSSSSSYPLYSSYSFPSSTPDLSDGTKQQVINVKVGKFLSYTIGASDKIRAL